MIIHFRVTDFDKVILTMESEVIPEKGTKVCIPMTGGGMGKIRKTFIVQEVVYDYQPVSGPLGKYLFTCVINVTLL